MKKFNIWKKLSILMGLFLALSLTSWSQCTYTLKMDDSYGDGWNGNTMDVLVNSTVVLNDVTLSSGSSGTMAFSVSTGDSITTVWNGGGLWGSETSYEILDCAGIVVGSGAQSNISTPIVASCPTCPAPSNIAAGNITTNSAQISWTSGGASNWNIEYGPAGFTQGTGTYVADVSNPYTITGLASGTLYDVYVQDSCSSTDVSSWAGPQTFSSALTLPYTQGWEGGSFGSWSQVTYDDRDWSNNTGGTTSSGTGPSSANEGSHYIYCETSSPVNNGDVFVLESPTFDFSSTTNPSIMFDYHMNWDGTYSDGTLKLDVSTNGGSTWTQEWSKSGHQGSNWQNTTVSLSSYNSSSNVMLRFHFTVGSSGSSFDYDAAIDYVNISDITCPPPSGLSASSITSSSASLSWTENGSATTWQIEYGSTGFTQGNGTKTVVTSKPYNLTGLSSSSSYDYYVRSICGPNDTSIWKGSYTFGTTAAAPFFEGFEHGGSWPATMTRSSSSDVMISSSCSSSGSYSMRIDGVSGENAVTPAINTNSDTNIIAFDWRNGCNNDPEGSDCAQVEYWDGSSWNVLSGWPKCDDHSSWSSDSNIIVTSNSDFKLRFYVNSGSGSSMDDWDFDNIEIKGPPSCMWPSSVSSTNVVDTAATITWTRGGSSNWNIEYGSAGFTQGNGTTVMNVSKPYTITGLSSGNAYDVYVQDSCGTSNVSFWTGPYTFTTSAALQNIPFSDGFESNLNPYTFTGTGSPTTTTSESYKGSQSLQLVQSSNSQSSATITFLPSVADSLSFAYYIEYYYYNEFSVEIKESGSSTWTKIHEFSGSYSDDDQWIDKQFDLSSYNTNSGPFQIRLNAKNNYSYSSYEVYVDDFEITTPPANDMAIAAWNAPIDGFASSSKLVEVEVANVGLNAQTNSTVSYSIDGGNTWTTETINQTISPGNSVMYTFSSTATMDTIGQYSCLAAVNISGDTIKTGNDTLSKTVGVFPAHALPVAENFESFSGSAWNFTPTSGYRWELESGQTSSSSTGPSGDHTTGNGSYLAIEASYGGTGDIAYLYSPYIDTTTYPANPILKFYYHMYGADMGDLYIQELTNNSWSTIDSIKGEQQTSMSDPWLLKSVNLSSNAIQVRFKAISGGSVNGDMSLDDINIPLANDLAMKKATAPTSGIDLQSSMNVTVEIINKGFNTQSNFDLKYSTDSGSTYTTEAIAATLNPDSTLTHTFSTQADLSTTGTYDMVYIVDNTGDAARKNDTIKTQIENVDIPYFENFDSISAPNLPSGYSFINETSSGYVETDNYQNVSAPNSWHMYNSSASSGENLFAIMLPYFGNFNDKWITCDIYSESTSDSIIVGVLSDPTDATTFTGVDTITFPNDYTWYTNKYSVFSGYSGTGNYIAFKHTSTDSYEDMYIDNLVLETAPTGPVFGANPDSIVMNPVRYNFPDTTTKTVSITNEGIGTLSVTNSALSGTNTGNFAVVDTNTYPKSLSTLESLDIQVKFFGSSQGNKTATLDVTANSTTHNIPLSGKVIDASIDSFPFVEKLEHNGNAPLGWRSYETSSYYWNIGQNTPSFNTGAQQDHTTGTGYFAYTEASSAGTGDSAMIVTVPVDFSSITTGTPKMNFWYHMHGSDMGDLYVDVAAGGIWISKIDSIKGEQQSNHSDPWKMKTVDLGIYASAADSIRFTAVSDGSLEGDISVDDIAFGKDLNVDLGPDTTICQGATYTLDAGANANWTYEWYAGNMSNLVATGQTLTIPDTAAKYYVKVTGIGNFTGVDSVNISTSTPPAISASANPNPIMYGFSTNLDVSVSGSSTYSYAWAPADSLANISDYNLKSPNTKSLVTPTTFTVTVTNAYGCTATDNVNVGISGGPLYLSATSNRDTVCKGDTTKLHANAYGGSGTYTYSWSSNPSGFSSSSEDPTVTVNTPATYIVTVNDGSNTAVDSVTVGTWSNPSVSVTSQNGPTYTICQSADTLSGTPAGGNYTGNALAGNVFSPSLAGTGTHDIYYTYTNANNCSTTDTLSLTVNPDNQAPTVLTSNISVYLDNNGQASITTSDIDNGSYDACGISSMSLNTTSFSCADTGANTVTLSVTDVNTNTASNTATVTVMDTINPNPSTQFTQVYLDATGQASITTSDVDNGTSDNCSIDSLTLSKTNFSCADKGSNVITFTAYDVSGNSSTAAPTVSVNDTISPTVSTQNVTAYLDASGQASITTSDIDNGSTDNCGINSMSLSKTSFSCSDAGTNTVTLTVKDSSLNTATATAQVTVSDSIAPTVMTQNTTVSLDASGQASITTSDIDNGSSDNCGISSKSLSKTSFSCSDIGTNTVTLTVTDNNNNSATATAQVTVTDNTAPSVATQNTTVYLDSSGLASITPADIDSGSSDNCSIDTLTLDSSNFSCGDLGTQTVTLTAKDASVNSNSATAQVTVKDTIAPVFTPMADTVVCSSGPFSFSMPTATDNCGASVTQISGPASGDTLSTGVYTFSFAATDSAGNTDSTHFMATVTDPHVDLGPDSVICHYDSITLTADAGYADYSWSTGDSTMSIIVDSLSMGLGTHTISVTVTDSLGCIATDSVTIKIEDCTGIDEYANEGEVNIFPNPNEGSFNLSIQGVKENCLEVCIYNFNGRKIKCEKIDRDFSQEFIKQYDLSDQAKGVYLIKITGDHTQKVKRMLIQ